MGFTFPMDANTSKYFYKYFMGIKQTLIRVRKSKKGLVRIAFKLLKSISGIERSVILPLPDT